MRDTLPGLYEIKKQLRNCLVGEIEKCGYQFIETPTLEYYETIGEASAILDQQLFKLIDGQGHTLVLRPDMTTPIARLAASKLYVDGCPLRLAYNANVFRAQQREGGRPAEFEQVGVECIGDETISADAEVIMLMISALKKAGLTNFKVAIGHVGFVNALFLKTLGNQERANTLRKLLYEKNYVGYREHIKQLPLSTIDKQSLLKLLQLRGTESVIQEANELVDDVACNAAIAELTKLWEILQSNGLTNYLKLDLNLVSHMSYYTGILFEVYAENVGFLIGNGGRYDQLLDKFGRSTHATGFGIRLDRLIEAIGEKTCESNLHCIIFSVERRKEAQVFANDRRGQGVRVVLQDINGIKNMDAFTNRFQDVTFYIGHHSKGGPLHE
jgi:ATP phosphoribosyltransferase regulatory subunit